MNKNTLDTINHVIDSQNKTGNWNDIYSGNGGAYICLTSASDNIKCFVTIDSIKNKAVIHISKPNQNESDIHKSVPVIGFHINTAINVLLKATLTPELLTVNDLPYLVVTNEQAIDNILASLEPSLVDKIMVAGSTPFQLGMWLVQINKNFVGHSQELFDLIFGKGSFDLYYHAVLKD